MWSILFLFTRIKEMIWTLTHACTYICIHTFACICWRVLFRSRTAFWVQQQYNKLLNWCSYNNMPLPDNLNFLIPIWAHLHSSCFNTVFSIHIFNHNFTQEIVEKKIPKIYVSHIFCHFVRLVYFSVIKGWKEWRICSFLRSLEHGHSTITPWHL